jgi:fatty-acyl-CoA synthase
VAYLGLNSITFLTTMFASWWLGAVFEPFNFRLAVREVAGLIEQSTPAVLVVEPAHAPIAESALELIGGDPAPEVVLVDNDPEAAGQEEAVHLATPLSVFVAAAEGLELPEPVPAAEDDLALLMFTSGTTGRPKGVQLTYGNVWWNSVNVDSLVDTRRGDTNLAVAPLFHIGGLNARPSARSCAGAGR